MTQRKTTGDLGLDTFWSQSHPEYKSLSNDVLYAGQEEELQTGGGLKHITLDGDFLVWRQVQTTPHGTGHKIGSFLKAPPPTIPVSPIFGIAKIKFCRMEYGTVDDRQLMESVKLYGGDLSFDCSGIDNEVHSAVKSSGGNAKSSGQSGMGKWLRLPNQKTSFITICNDKGYSETLFFTNPDQHEAWISKLNLVPVAHTSYERRYESVKKIAVDGFYQVILVEEIETRRNFVAKLRHCQGSFERSDTLHRNLFSEVEILLKCRNIEGVPKFYEMHITENMVCMIMEYINSPPLDVWLLQVMLERKLRRERILEVMQVIVEIVQNMSKLKVVHRNLNPRKILVPENRKGRTRAYIIGFKHARDYSYKDHVVPQESQVFATSKYGFLKQKTIKQDLENEYKQDLIDESSCLAILLYDM